MGAKGEGTGAVSAFAPAREGAKARRMVFRGAERFPTSPIQFPILLWKLARAQVAAVT